jgi:Tol biopolymer transport system component
VLLRNPHSAADTVDIIGPGRIVLSEDLTRQNLQEVTFDGSHAPRWLSRGMSLDRQPAYSRRGSSVIFASDRGGNLDIWELMLDSGSSNRITDHDGIDWDPHPTADGRSLLWSSNRGSHFEVWTASFDGANPQQVTQDGVDAENPSTPASGEWIFYDSSNPKKDGLWRVPRAGGPATLIVAAETIHPEVSADGKYVAYHHPEAGGSSAIDVVRVADGKVFTIATGITVTSLRTRWIGTTHTIAFRAPDAEGTIALFAQDFREGVDTTSTRRQLTRGNPDAVPETYAISPDGTRAIVAVVDEASGLMIAEGIEGVE